LRGLAQCLGHDLIEALRIDAAIQLTIDHHGRGERAIAQAIDGIERHLAVGAGLAEAQLEACFGVAAQGFARHRLAGFGPADLHHMAAGGLTAEIMIERDDAMHFGAGKVDGLGDDGDYAFRHTAQLLLHLMQDLDQFIRAVAVAIADVTGAFPVR
jgi:hypothetical protein